MFKEGWLLKGCLRGWLFEAMPANQEMEQAILDNVHVRDWHILCIMIWGFWSRRRLFHRVAEIDCSAWDLLNAFSAIQYIMTLIFRYHKLKWCSDIRKLLYRSRPIQKLTTGDLFSFFLILNVELRENDVLNNSSVFSLTDTESQLSQSSPLHE